MAVSLRAWLLVNPKGRKSSLTGVLATVILFICWSSVLKSVMKKILLFQVLLIVFLIAIFETASYGSDKFSEYYNKAIEHYKQGKYDQAGKQFEKALELKPNDAYALYGLGNTYYCKAKYDEAIKIYTKAISINPDYAKVHYSLSLAYNKMGMTHEAEKEKKIFRKISQGEKEDKKPSTQMKTSHSPVKTGERASTTERGRSGFGLTTGDKHVEQEHSDFGRTGHDHATPEHDKATDTDKHDRSAEQSHVAEETHAFSSKRSRDEAGRHSTKKTHVADKERAISSKGDHATFETHGGSKHSEQTASHGAEADHGISKEHVDRSTEPTERALVEHRDTTNKHVTSTHGTKKHLKEEDTHSIFQGYTKESSQPKSHLLVKKHGKAYGYDMSSLVYVKSKWTKSRIHKIFICVIGYVFITQMWLSVIAFFGFIVWRIRKKNLLG